MKTTRLKTGGQPASGGTPGNAIESMHNAGVNIIVLFVGIILIACSSVEDGFEKIPDTTGYGNTMLQLSAVTDPESSNQIFWRAGDKINVVDETGNSGIYEVAAGIGTNIGEFKGQSEFDGSPLVAMYPASSYIEGETVHFSIPSFQSKDSYNDCRMMVAKYSDSYDEHVPLFEFSEKTAILEMAFDFTSNAEYEDENVYSIEVYSEDINFIGDGILDISNADARLECMGNQLTYSFSPSIPMAQAIDFSATIAPCDMTQSQKVTYTVKSDTYTFVFRKKPDVIFGEKSVSKINIKLDEFVVTDAEVPAEGEVKITRELPAIDLSADGPSNCYIVDREARCSFDATIIGNGDEGIIPDGNFVDYLGRALTSSSITPASAEMLWQYPDGLISDVILTDGRVNFNSSGKEGNAVIAVYDESGIIMWSWHIWLTDKPADETYMENKYGNVWTFMDRNLGATSAVDDGSDSYGLVYQWGRKDPIPCAREFNSITEPEISGKYNEVPIVTPDVSTGTIQYAIQNPVTYLMRADWLMESNDYLWGNPDGDNMTTTWQKTIYDPCPHGYKVPGKDAWSIFTVTGENTTDAGSHNVVPPAGTKRGYYLYYKEYGTGLQTWYPTNGSRNYRTGGLTRGSWWYYWTSAPSAGTQAWCMTFKNDWKEVDPLYEFQRGNANTTRCVRE